LLFEGKQRVNRAVLLHRRSGAVATIDPRETLRKGCAVDWIDALQWPAMLVTIAGAWLVASSQEGRRRAGFYVYLLSNVLWSTWGWHTHAYALILLQAALLAMNLRGVVRNEDAQ
jgi:hypothetical protein